jgi:hypothetical protein
MIWLDSDAMKDESRFIEALAVCAELASGVNTPRSYSFMPGQVTPP